MAANPLRGEAVSKRPPNFIIILTDDLGYGDLECYGSKVQHTPCIDRMASEGMRFTDFYVTSPVCTPTRVACMTGRYPLRAGLTALLWPNDKEGLPPSEITIAKALKGQGYATACVGKWHMGDQPQWMPLQHGFDYWYGMLYPNDFVSQHPVAKSRKQEWPPLTMYRNEVEVEKPVDVNTLTQKYTAESIQWIEKNKDKPFFLYLAHAMPHTILGASKEFRGKSKNGLYGDAVQELDWSTGQILDTLKRLKLDHNTVVVFTSDNGASTRKEKPDVAVEKLFHPDDTWGSNGPLKGGKQNTFEGGVREPFIVWAPGIVQPGQTVKEPAIILDLFPTFVELAGGQPPADRVIDGCSLVALMKGQGKRRETDLYFGSGKITGCRSGRWKLQIGSGPTGILKGKPGEVMLFDLETDIGETKNVADEHKEIVERLQRQINEFEQSCTKRP